MKPVELIVRDCLENSNWVNLFQCDNFKFQVIISGSVAEHNYKGLKSYRNKTGLTKSFSDFKEAKVFFNFIKNGKGNKYEPMSDLMFFFKKDCEKIKQK